MRALDRVARCAALVSFSCASTTEPVAPVAPLPVAATATVATPVATGATVTAPDPSPPTFPPSDAPVFESGFASWYGSALAGHKTASGQIFDPSKLTAAHRTLKLGTWVEVRRRDTGRYLRVRVNDRGPVSHRFVIDLSSEAARELGMLRMGVAPVELRIVQP